MPRGGEATLAAAALITACALPADDSFGTLSLEIQRSNDFGINPAPPEGAARVCADEMIKGIDVSKWQGSINWNAVAADNVRFAFIRVSDGLEYDDPQFERNWRIAKKHGVLRAAYQFFRPGQDPIAQADYLLDTMGPLEPGDLPPVLDLEVTDGKSKDVVARKARRWIEHVEAELGITPIIYTSPSFWGASVARPAQFIESPLWVAHWTSDCPLVPLPWETWTFWQFTNKGKVTGIEGRVDVNRFNGTFEELREYGGVPPEPSCGDSICEADETADDSCSLDCGESEEVAEIAGGCSTGSDAPPLSVVIFAVIAARTSRRRRPLLPR